MEIKTVRIKFQKYLHNTGKAILVRVNGAEHWLPNYRCRNLTVNNKLGGHVCIPASLCDEKGIDYDISMAEITYEHHIPAKITKEVKHIKDLER